MSLSCNHGGRRRRLCECQLNPWLTLSPAIAQRLTLDHNKLVREAEQAPNKETEIADLERIESEAATLGPALDALQVVLVRPEGNDAP